jgi:hypothetical protein
MGFPLRSYPFFTLLETPASRGVKTSPHGEAKKVARAAPATTLPEVLQMAEKILFIGFSSSKRGENPFIFFLFQNGEK